MIDWRSPDNLGASIDLSLFVLFMILPSCSLSENAYAPEHCHSSPLLLRRQALAHNVEVGATRSVEEGSGVAGPGIH